jgi:hypothetical protein
MFASSSLTITNNNMTTAQNIEAGQTLTIRFIGDAQLKAFCKVVSRTNASAKILIDGKIESKKIYKSYDGSEYVLPYGKYSMCPVARP